MTGISVCDLHYWELVLVQMYRSWRTEGPTVAVAEHRLATRLRNERIYPFMDGIFGLFGALRKVDTGDSDPHREQLTHAELLLLDLVSGDVSAEAEGQGAFVSRNPAIQGVAATVRDGLAQAGISVRHRRMMAQSEEERLENAISRAYRAIFRME